MTAMARADPTNLNLIDLISVPLIFRRYRNNRHASELRMLSGAGSKYLWIWKFKLNQTSVMQFKPNCQLTGLTVPVRSVPPRGSGWVLNRICQAPTPAKSRVRCRAPELTGTHPLPRGGTDVMKQAPPSVSVKLTDQSLSWT